MAPLPLEAAPRLATSDPSMKLNPDGRAAHMPDFAVIIPAAASTHGAAVPALPVSLTIKQAHGPLPARVEKTIPRENLWAMQTPQIMRRADLLNAFKNCPIPLAQVTDDVQLIELAGGQVWLVAGEERNLKITTPIDLKIAEILLAS